MLFTLVILDELLGGLRRFRFRISSLCKSLACFAYAAWAGMPDRVRFLLPKPGSSFAGLLEATYDRCPC